MELATAIYVLLVTALLLYRWYKNPENFPLGPRGLPLVGSIPFVGKNPERTFKKWSRVYGPVMSVRMGMKNWVVLNDYESIYEALVKNKEHFNGRNKIPFIEQWSKGHGVVHVDYNAHWKAQRRFGVAALRSLGYGKKSMETRVQNEAQHLVKAIRLHKGKPFNILGMLTNAVANNICGVVYGRRYDYDDTKFNKVLHDLGMRFNDPHLGKISKMLVLAPILQHLPNVKRASKVLFEYEDNVLNYIKEAIAEHDRTFDPEKPRDFIDYFRIAQKSENDGSFTNIQLEMYVRDLFAAGTETTTSTLRWAIVALLHHPEIQKKLHKEIHGILGKDEAATLANKEDLRYTCAFIEEVYRHRTLVPRNLPHKTNSDVVFYGYNIPKDTQILTNLWAVHNDPKVFPEPDKFKPERFINDECKFVKSNQVIPFGIGPRHCLGEHLARMEVLFFLVTLVQKFKFHALPGKVPSLMEGLNGFVYTPYAYEVTAEEW